MADIDLDALIAWLWSIKDHPVGTSAHVTEAEVAYLWGAVIPIFEQKPVLLELQPPVTIVGDAHGQFHNLIRVFDNGKMPAHGQFLFLRDYVD
jgi:serine/threonine-protein phosphatase PP1 catalytic subunit